MSHQRPTSSVYSDSFELESLVRKLSHQLEDQEHYDLIALTTERDSLLGQISSLRREVDSMEHARTVSVALARKVQRLLRKTQRLVRIEEAKWVASRTVL